MSKSTHYGNSTADQKEYIKSMISTHIHCVADYELIDAGLWKLRSCSLMELMDNLYSEECTNCSVEYESECECGCYEPAPQEPMEFYFVSEWLGEQLKKINEPVLCDEFRSGVLWGRTCSGQSIELDNTFWDIFQDQL